MAAKKSGWIVNPNTTLLHNGKSYKGGSVVDMSDEEIVKLPFGTLVPASSKMMSESITAEGQVRIDTAKARLEAAKKELASIEEAEAERVSTFEKDTEAATMRIEQAQKEVHEAEQAQVKAQADFDGGKPEVVETPLSPAMAAAVAAREAAEKASKAEGGKKK